MIDIAGRIDIDFKDEGVESIVDIVGGVTVGKDRHGFVGFVGEVVSDVDAIEELARAQVDLRDITSCVCQDEVSV